MFGRHGWARISTLYGFNTVVVVSRLQLVVLMSLLLLSGWIAVVSSITLMGVYFMDLVISRNAWFCTLSNADDRVVDPYSRCGRIVPIYTFLTTVSAAPHWVPASFLSKSNLHIALASALLMSVFQVCLLSNVIPRYVLCTTMVNETFNIIILKEINLFTFNARCIKGI